MIVLLAEIRNKLSENFIYRAKSSEDQLTGNLFGALRYLPFDKGLLLLLSPKAKAKRIYEQNYKREEMALQHFHFGYINLEDCYGPLKKLEKAENDKFRYLIMKDLCDLLECKGFSVFNGFNNIPEAEIDPGKYYTFNISHQNSARR